MNASEPSPKSLGVAELLCTVRDLVNEVASALGIDPSRVDIGANAGSPSRRSLAPEDLRTAERALRDLAENLDSDGIDSDVLASPPGAKHLDRQVTPAIVYQANGEIDELLTYGWLLD